MLGACQNVGPIAIDTGRDRYNSIIQSTSKQQAFANIVRVHYNEPTSFVDVTEVDATQTFSTTLGGSITGIGSKPGTFGTLGSISPGVTYSEAPLIRYIPLVGQGLVEQTVAPVNTDALASLYDSQWPIMPLVDLAMPYLTLDRGQVGAAVNLIAELDYSDRLRVTSTKSNWTGNSSSSGNGSDGQGSANNSGANKKTPTSSSTNDALVFYFLTPHGPGNQKTRQLWDWLMRLYQGTQLATCAPAQKKRSKDCMPAEAPYLELRTMPVTKTPSPFRYTGPLMRTFSALGILRSATQPPNPRIAFVSPDDYYKITHYWWNDPDHKDSLLCVYTVAPDDLQKGEEEFSHARSEAKQNRIDEHWANQKLDQWLKENYDEQQVVGNARLSLPYVFWRHGLSDNELATVNYRLWELRRYVLIIESDTPPPADAYVAYFDHGLWHYIDGGDKISQKNFNLVSLFMTVMASPPTSAPLSTSITIGGGG